eukprot:gene3798-4727_t
MATTTLLNEWMDQKNWEHLYQHPISKSNWTELIDMEGFEFKLGVTPFSQFHIIPTVLVIYLATIFGIKAFMKNREPFSLKSVVVGHNLILCLWSVIMCAGVIYEVFKRISSEGPLFTVCEVAPGFNKDTVIIVLKKKPLIFLHVYHHCVVVWLCWYFLHSGWPLQIWVVFLNTFVHVFMYYFYLQCALGNTVWWKKYITGIQILQFCCLGVVGVLHFSAIQLIGCQTHWSAFASAYSINFSFLFLFTKFFNKSYTKPAVGGKVGTSSPVLSHSKKTKKIE